jgi:hypothetical protein
MGDQLTLQKTAPAGSGNVMLWGGVLVGGLVLALVAQFLLDTFAETSNLGHWTQHALLFWSGLMTGAGVLRLYQLGSRAA